MNLFLFDKGEARVNEEAFRMALQIAFDSDNIISFRLIQFFTNLFLYDIIV